MIALQSVLCPIDFSPATSRQIELAADVCRAFGGKLILHHNKPFLGTSASVGWMWKADHPGHSQAAVDTRLRECLAQVPDGVTAEGLVTEGPVSRAVLEVADGLDADLVVLTAHGTLSDAHASITRLILESGRRPVLVLHEPSVEKRTPKFAAPASEPQVVVAPTDLTPESSAAVDLSIDLARKLPIELHLLHLLPNGRYRHNEADDEAARHRLRALIPEDLANRALLHVEHGDAGQAIARVADQLSASCIVMGEHTRRPLRRWFSRDVSRDVLHRAHCPVWYVPAHRAA